MVKEMVTGSPMLIGLLLTPSEGATTGATAEVENIINIKIELAILYNTFHYTATLAWHHHKDEEPTSDWSTSPQE